MPGRQRQPPAPIDASLCRRCQTATPAITVRNEPLCKACFTNYVQTKVVKRMETFRVRHSDPRQERTLLLPFSFDPSSVALLHVLSHHLQGQIEKTGRTGYRIRVLHVDGELSGGTKENVSLDDLKARYPSHEYHSARFDTVLSSEDLSDLFPTVAGVSGTPEDRLYHVLTSPKSATSRQDLSQILKQRLVVQQAKVLACEAILWADSTTKLAERTLAETAKGRGLSLPWIIADGESPHGVPFYYPLRELLNKEIEAYISFIDPPLDGYLIKPDERPVVSTKNTSIDDLMRQYFESAELDYPSIVANVVRTTSKLKPMSLSEVEQQCELCHLPLEGRAPDRSRLCFCCIRLIPNPDNS